MKQINNIQGGARQGGARHGMAWHGKARHGVWQNYKLPAKIK